MTKNQIRTSTPSGIAQTATTCRRQKGLRAYYWCGAVVGICVLPSCSLMRILWMLLPLCSTTDKARRDKNETLTIFLHRFRHKPCGTLRHGERFLPRRASGGTRNERNGGRNAGFSDFLTMIVLVLALALGGLYYFLTSPR